MSARVSTRLGQLEGTRERGVRVFRGVPYARPPVGALRFRAPEPPAPWSGVRRSVTARAASPQAQLQSGPLSRIGWIPGAGADEDCLYLNVFAPGEGSTGCPVMVFIHGGGFTSGSGSWGLYAGHDLVTRGGVVVVTLNYRLGALGALQLASRGAGAASNPGLRDQIAALRWVREHIEAFGGDPESITVFGQSAGAMSIGSLLAADDARGLFQRAILQSGAASNAHTPAAADAIVEDVAQRLDLDADAGDFVDRLRALPVEALLEAQLGVSESHRLPLGQLAWQPTIDGALLEEAPLERLRRAPPAGIPVLIGTNLDEWRMFTAFDTKRRNLDEPTLLDYLTRTFAQDHAHAHGSAAEHAREVAALYLEAHAAEPSRGAGRRSPADAWVAIQTDRVFRIPAVELADALSRHPEAEPVFAYRFDWAPRLMRDRAGACHSMELPFVFGAVRRPLLRPFIGLSPGALRVSDAMQDAWIAFARGADPSGAGAAWPAWQGDAASARIFGERMAHAPAFPPALRAFWSKVGALSGRAGDVASKPAAPAASAPARTTG